MTKRWSLSQIQPFYAQLHKIITFEESISAECLDFLETHGLEVGVLAALIQKATALVGSFFTSLIAPSISSIKLFT